MPRVLIADDDPDILDLVRSILERSGYEAVTSSGGRDAVSKAENDSFDLVIVDVVMPEGGGIEALVQLRADRPNLKTMIISGRIPVDIDPVQNLAEQLGAHCVLAKPFSPAELLACVERTLAEPKPPGPGDIEIITESD